MLRFHLRSLPTLPERILPSVGDAVIVRLPIESDWRIGRTATEHSTS